MQSFEFGDRPVPTEEDKRIRRTLKNPEEQQNPSDIGRLSVTYVLGTLCTHVPGPDLGKLEARVGFEPTNGGFADLSLGPLGYRAKTVIITKLGNPIGRL